MLLDHLGNPIEEGQLIFWPDVAGGTAIVLSYGIVKDIRTSKDGKQQYLMIYRLQTDEQLNMMKKWNHTENDSPFKASMMRRAHLASVIDNPTKLPAEYITSYADTAKRLRERGETVIGN